jgi:CRISPR type III-A-associated RAMP protein Csm4
MNPGLVVKLRPSGPWRIGPDSGARNRVDVIYHSDSLYSAITAAMARLGWLGDWLDATARSGSPAVSFSSCFPYLDDLVFVVPPRTVWPPVSPSAQAARVRWKSARFVPLTVVHCILNGQRLDENQWSVDGPSDCLVPAGKAGPFRTAVRSNAGVDRLTGAGERHSTACIEFRAGSGLWTVVSFADQAAHEQWSDKVKAAFRLLADTGFGGERSRGWGRSDAPEFTEGMLPDLILPAVSKAAEAAVIPPTPVVATLVVEAEAAPAEPEAPAAEPDVAAVEPEAPAEVAEAAVIAPTPVAALVVEAEAALAEPEVPVVEPEVAAEVLEAAVIAPTPVAPMVVEAEAAPAEPEPPVVEPEPSRVETAALLPSRDREGADPEPAAVVVKTEAPVVEAETAPAEPELSRVETAALLPSHDREGADPETEPAAAPEVAAVVVPEPGRAEAHPTVEPEAPLVHAGAPMYPHWLLSLFTPAPADSVDWRRGNYTVLTRGGRIDSPAASGDLKKVIQMVAEGSVLYAESVPRGSAADVAPDGFAHPVFRAGFAVAIPLPEVR